jgi:hypothetical protein
MYCYMSELDNYYVYGYFNPDKIGTFQYGNFQFEHEPFYIGMGTGDRMYEHLTEAKGISYLKRPNKLKAYEIRMILETGKEPIVSKIQENLSEGDAFNLENSIIELIGKKIENRGPLTNISDGGGYRPKLSGKLNPMYGKKWDKKQKKDQSVKIKNWWRNLSDTDREKYLSNLKRSLNTPEHKKLLSDRSMGKNNGMYGKQHTKKTKKLIRQKAIENKRFKGMDNPKAKNWKVVSITGQTFEVCGTLHQFCKDKNIGNADGLKLAGKQNRFTKKGWRAIEIKTGKKK